MQLLPLYPRHCPTDIGIIVQPQASPSHQPPHPYLVIDVTITAMPKSPCHDATLNLYNPYAAQAQKVHWDSTRAKFLGHRHGMMANLNQIHITLIPFTIDLFSSFGYFAQRLPPLTLFFLMPILNMMPLPPLGIQTAPAPPNNGPLKSKALILSPLPLASSFEPQPRPYQPPMSEHGKPPNIDPL
jgi:hypothetical protein